MFRYFLKRLFIFIPTFLGVSLIVFGLSKLTPGDPVLNLVQVKKHVVSHAEYQQMAELLGLDKPAFYFSLSSIAHPDTLHEVLINDHNKTLNQLISQYGNGELVIDYYNQINQLTQAFQKMPDSLKSDATIEIRRAFQQLYVQYEDGPITSLLNKVETNYQSEQARLSPFLGKSASSLLASYTKIKQEPTRWKLYIPAIKWNGFDNQYHNWIVNFFKGDFGNSIKNGRSVTQRVKGALWWTLIMNLLAIFFAFLFSVPLGVWSAVRKGSFFDRATSLVLFILFSMPVFWVATMLLVFFTTPEYGEWLDIFPSVGLGDFSADIPFWDRFWDRAVHMILPVFCLTYGALAYLSRQVRGAMLDSINQDYIRTARAKGLPEHTVTWRHAFRNSLFPLISIVAMIFPTVLAGSVIVEYIFNIPGMGRLVFDSIIEKDWPIVYTVLMLTAILAMLGNLIGDMLYAKADPRVSYD